MTISLSDFDYHLPLDRIAQEPANPRESAKLMVLPQSSEEIIHDMVGSFPSYLKSTDILVVNNTKVFNARLHGSVARPDKSQKTVELFLIKPVLWDGSKQENNSGSFWQAIGKPGKVLTIGTTITISDNFNAQIVDKDTHGTMIVSFQESTESVIEQANIYREIPTPPYIHRPPKPNEYQTTYAKITGSVAAPTAGFHLTKNLLKEIQEKRVTIVEITLHVGLGTFLPIKTDTIEAHEMHSEWVEITEEAARTINMAKRNGQRVIAVGTTTVRALEGSSVILSGAKNLAKRSEFFPLHPYSGEVNIFIKPGFEFKIIDGLLTNFHLPKSTLLLLVSALAGTTRIQNAYKEAVEKNYRFYSFGDAMLII